MSGTLQYIRVPDWSDRAQQRLLVPWRKPRIMAFVSALAEGVQAHEDLTFDVLASTGLEEAGGHALDQWGELVGEQRLGLSDNEYRPFIKARMLVNRCDGTVDALLHLLETAAGPVIGVFHTDVQPATYVLVAERSSFLTAAARRRVARLMQAAAPAGRRLIVIEALHGGFGWPDSPDILTSGYSAGGFARLIVGTA